MIRAIEENIYGQKAIEFNMHSGTYQIPIQVYLKPWIHFSRVKGCLNSPWHLNFIFRDKNYI